MLQFRRASEKHPSGLLRLDRSSFGLCSHSLAKLCLAEAVLKIQSNGRDIFHRGIIHHTHSPYKSILLLGGQQYSKPGKRVQFTLSYITQILPDHWNFLLSKSVNILPIRCSPKGLQSLKLGNIKIRFIGNSLNLFPEPLSHSSCLINDLQYLLAFIPLLIYSTFIDCLLQL